MHYNPHEVVFEEEASQSSSSNNAQLWLAATANHPQQPDLVYCSADAYPLPHKHSIGNTSTTLNNRNLPVTPTKT